MARTFQNGRLFRDSTVRENLEAGAIGVGLSRRQAYARAVDILDWLELGETADVRADTVPYGIERRVGIARALATHPRWLLLDEPAAGLNDRECEVLMGTLSRMADAFGCGVLIIEHNMRVIMNVCERIHVIDFGRTIAEGTPKEVRENPDVIGAYLGKHRR
ncbi:MAG: ABC transporter ATP-binding protein [Alphaproteobacteria bacterium]|nr:ABC transporter ATP-binding protein [Alphaproteobacteria bacterium]